MQTIEVNVPDDVLNSLGSVSKERETFVLEAIKEKINREKKRNLPLLLAEGYRAVAKEDLKVAKEFEAADFENL